MSQYTLDSDFYLPQSFSMDDVVAIFCLAVFISIVLICKIIANSCNVSGSNLFNVKNRKQSVQREDVVGISREMMLKLNHLDQSKEVV